MVTLGTDDIDTIQPLNMSVFVCISELHELIKF